MVPWSASEDTMLLSAAPTLARVRTGGLSLRGYLAVRHILAYFPKVPGNLGQHFLDIPHANPPRSGVDLHHIHMERAPHRFFFRKKVEVAKSHSFPIEITFVFGAARRRLAAQKIFGVLARICAGFI